MPEENHRFKRTVIQGDVEKDIADKEEENAQKILDFEWADKIVKHENDSDKPISYDEADAEACVKRLATSILDNMSRDQMQVVDEGLAFSVSIDPSVHWLLAGRFCEEWSLESRLVMFSDISERLSTYFDNADNLACLDKVVQELMPASDRKMPIVSAIDLLDDPMAVDDEINTISAELQLKFVGHL